MAKRVRKVYYPEVGTYLTKLRSDRGWARAQTAVLAHNRKLFTVTLNKLNTWEFGKTLRMNRPFLDELAELYGEPALFRTVAKIMFGSDPLGQSEGVDSPSEALSLAGEGSHGSEHQARLLELHDRLDQLVENIENAHDAIRSVGSELKAISGAVKALTEDRGTRRDPPTSDGLPGPVHK